MYQTSADDSPIGNKNSSKRLYDAGKSVLNTSASNYSFHQPYHPKFLEIEKPFERPYVESLRYYAGIDDSDPDIERDGSESIDMVDRYTSSWSSPHAHGAPSSNWIEEVENLPQDGGEDEDDAGAGDDDGTSSTSDDQMTWDYGSEEDSQHDSESNTSFSGNNSLSDDADENELSTDYSDTKEGLYGAQWALELDFPLYCDIAQQNSVEADEDSEAQAAEGCFESFYQILQRHVSM